MSIIRTLVQVSMLAACGATSFVSAQAYMAAKEQVRAETNATQAPVVTKLSDNGNPKKEMSPLIPTPKYAVSVFAMPAPKAATVTVVAAKPAQRLAVVQRPVKKVATAQTAKRVPIQLASFTQAEQPRAYGYASEPMPPRAAGIFGIFR